MPGAALSTLSDLACSSGEAPREPFVAPARAVDYAARHAHRAQAAGRLEAAAQWISVAATLAWNAPPGFLACKALDEALADMSSVVLAGEPQQCRWSDVPPGSWRVLHVLSRAYGAGGHTRVVARWIGQAASHRPADEHCVALVDQGAAEVPDWLSDAVRRANGRIHELSAGKSQVNRARALFRLAQGWATLVILHIHPNDPIPWLAFASPARAFPVVFFNHADHVFSLGVRLGDLVIEFRESGRDLSLHGRGIDPCKDTLVPLPLEDPLPGLEEAGVGLRRRMRAEARARLNLPPEASIALTIGTAYKYEPALGLNFSRTAGQILEKCPHALILAVGLPNRGRWSDLERATEGRFRPLGVVYDKRMLQDIYSAADVYLEGFPFSSLTAMLDAALYMLPIQRLRNLRVPILSGDDLSLEGTVSDAFDEAGYAIGASVLLHRSAEERSRVGLLLRRRVLEEHCGSSWFHKWLEPAIDGLSASCVRAIADEGSRGAETNKTQGQGVDPIVHESIFRMRREGQDASFVLYSLLNHPFHLCGIVRWPLLLYALRTGEGFGSRQGLAHLAMNLVTNLMGDRLARALYRALKPAPGKRIRCSAQRPERCAGQSTNQPPL